MATTNTLDSSARTIARRGFVASLATVLATWPTIVIAEESSQGAYGRLRSSDVKIEIVGFVAQLEGVSIANDGSVLFSNVKEDAIERIDMAGTLSTLRKPANYPNGSAIDAHGRHVVCEIGNEALGLPARLTRTEMATGKQEILADSYRGASFQGPNDVRIDLNGRIYFTDGSRPTYIPPLSERAIAAQVDSVGVYRIDPDGSLHRILAQPALRQPNGLAIAADMRTLYLIENDPSPSGLRRLLSFHLSTGGEASDPRILHDFFPGRSGDGMIVDRNGDLLVAAGLNGLRGSAETLAVPAGIHVFSPTGMLKEFIPIWEDAVTNIAQSHLDPMKYYVTAGKSIFSISR